MSEIRDISLQNQHVNSRCEIGRLVSKYLRWSISRVKIQQGLCSCHTVAVSHGLVLGAKRLNLNRAAEIILNPDVRLVGPLAPARNTAGD